MKIYLNFFLFVNNCTQNSDAPMPFIEEMNILKKQIKKFEQKNFDLSPQLEIIKPKLTKQQYDSEDTNKTILGLNLATNVGAIKLVIAMKP